ncbi:MAG TPA: FtsW/RodA/SpoVE family cell cycle protein, partial [Gammaproteobacteria bacterium]
MRRFSSFRDFDWMLLTLVVLMSIISVLEIKSATLQTKFRGFDHKQVEFLLLGLVLMFLISFIDYHRLLDIGPWAYGVGLFALVAVALVGTKVMGARRWINLGGGVHFQPSEWVKLILIVVIARYFWGLAGRELSWKDIGKAFALVCIPMLLVLKQPDLGTALTYFPVLVAGLFLGGIRFRQVAILLLGFTVLIGGAVLSGKRLKPYQQARINSFINPDTDPKGAGYQIKQSLIAVG